MPCAMPPARGPRAPARPHPHLGTAPVCAPGPPPRLARPARPACTTRARRARARGPPTYIPVRHAPRRRCPLAQPPARNKSRGGSCSAPPAPSATCRAPRHQPRDRLPPAPGPPARPATHALPQLESPYLRKMPAPGQGQLALNCITHAKYPGPTTPPALPSSPPACPALPPACPAHHPRDSSPPLAPQVPCPQQSSCAKTRAENKTLKT